MYVYQTLLEERAVALAKVKNARANDKQADAEANDEGVDRMEMGSVVDGR